MILRMGLGSFRTRVGMAKISSRRASSGFSSRSTTSIWYRPLRCSAQILLRFVSAALDFDVFFLQLVGHIADALSRRENE